MLLYVDLDFVLEIASKGTLLAEILLTDLIMRIFKIIHSSISSIELEVIVELSQKPVLDSYCDTSLTSARRN